MAIASATNPVVDQITVGGILISTGSGAPSFAAVKGSLYVNTSAASTTTRLYINTGGAGDTVWAGFTALG